MTTAVIYTRLSYDKHGDGLAVERQEAECRALADRLGLRVTAIFSDNDVSATSGVTRPGFESLLASRPEAIVVWHQDRLLRLTRDLERVISHDVPVYTVAAGTMDLSHPAGRATARTVAAWAQYETEQKAARQRSANRQRAELGRPYWRVRPFGFELTGEHVPAEAGAVRDAADAVLRGVPLAAIARDWSAQGLTTVRTGKTITAAGIKDILLSERIAGVLIHAGERYPASWEAIVSPETHAAVRHVLTNPARTTNAKPSKVPSRLLVSIATCGKDGCDKTVNAGSRRGVPLYECTSRHLARVAEPFESAVVELTADLLSRPGVLQATLTDETPDVANLHAERIALTARRDEWLTSGMGPRDVATALSPIDARLAKIEAELSQATTASALTRLILSAASDEESITTWRERVWDTLSLHEQRTIVAQLWRVNIAARVIEPTDLTRDLHMHAVPSRAWARASYKPIKMRRSFVFLVA